MRKLKLQMQITVYGGATFVSSLIVSRLIDEFHLLVNPVTLGNGMTIFRSEKKQNLILKKSIGFETGKVLLYYEPIKN